MESWNCPFSAAAGGEKLSRAQHIAAVLYLYVYIHEGPNAKRTLRRYIRVNFALALEWTGHQAALSKIASPRCNIKLLRFSSVCASLQFALIRGDKINFQRQARRQQEMIRFLCLFSFSAAGARARLLN
jgi:hypothetical protein